MWRIWHQCTTTGNRSRTNGELQIGNSSSTAGENTFSAAFVFDESDVLTSADGNFYEYLNDK
ncbi:hypothetical protein [Patiriisocius sp. Uisw_017]|uniref:hypothetical protein n=1 Tax=Patiriisocius sp. Uisw_017 TaxID=3230968 RepID=UPI0039EC39A8